MLTLNFKQAVKYTMFNDLFCSINFPRHFAVFRYFMQETKNGKRIYDWKSHIKSCSITKCVGKDIRIHKIF